MRGFSGGTLLQPPDNPDNLDNIHFRFESQPHDRQTDTAIATSLCIRKISSDRDRHPAQH